MIDFLRSAFRVSIFKACRALNDVIVLVGLFLITAGIGSIGVYRWQVFLEGLHRSPNGGPTFRMAAIGISAPIPFARTFRRKVGPYEKSATVREVLDAMWLFNDKFEKAPSKSNEIKASRNDQQAR